VQLYGTAVALATLRAPWAGRTRRTAESRARALAILVVRRAARG
jgi:hypothetical protein